ncbi:MAG: ABC transporter permease [Streptosporangiaceae bacterium]
MRTNRTWSVRVGIVILVVFVVMAVVGPWLVGDPNATTAPLNSPPTGAHPLGTTNIGQDVLAQLVVGARGSLVVATLAAVIATAAAIAVGVTGAVLGGLWDDVMSLFTNAMLVIPTLPLVVVIAGYIKNAGGVVVAIVIAVTGWSWSARIFRAQTLSLRRRDFVLAARSSGEGAFRIVLFEVLPHLIPLIAAQFLGIVLYAIMTQAGLAFLGIGSVTNWTWGTMLYWANSAQAFQLGYWWWYVPPGLCIALFGMALVLLNNAIDSVADNRAERLPRRSLLRRAAGADAAAEPVAEEVAA